MLKDALLTLKKREVSQDELEATRKICLSNLSFITEILIQYISTPDDCINLLNRSQRIKNELNDI
tara:strand:+ start:19275 stop:19469 length:195 start_codon:yes stop_codon:yes gene_type:complete